MTWLLTRQHRTFGLAIAGIVAAFTVAVVLTGIHMADVYASAQQCHDGRCLVVGRLFQGYGAIVDAVRLTLVVPVVFAAFGAVLIARETDSGTNALVWTQSVTRRRWLVAKIAMAVVAAVVVAAIVSGLVTWWSGTTNSLYGDRFQGAQFDTQNIVPVADALFAVALGLAVGAWLRRVLPALATAIFLYVGVRMLTAVYLRPHYMAPVSKLLTPGSEAGLPSGAWTLTRRLLGPSGRVIGGDRIAVPQGCAARGRDVMRCLARLGYRDEVSFHPPSHYWQFQWTEVAIFVVLSVGLLAFAYFRTARRDA